MNQTPRDIETLIDLMARLPGLGPRSARRAVLALLKKREALMAPLATALAGVALSARDCTLCGNIGTSDQCAICTDPARDIGEICVVEDLIVAAIQDAQAKATARNQQEMARLGESLGLPPDMKLPF